MSVARKTFTDDGHDHVIAVDGKETNRKRSNVMKIVISKEVARKCMTNEEKCDINCKNGNLEAKEKTWYE